MTEPGTLPPSWNELERWLLDKQIETTDVRYQEAATRLYQARTGWGAPKWPVRVSTLATKDEPGTPCREPAWFHEHVDRHHGEEMLKLRVALQAKEQEIAACRALVSHWRDAAVWEHDDMSNTQSAQAFDQCASELESALATRTPPPPEAQP